MVRRRSLFMGAALAWGIVFCCGEYAAARQTIVIGSLGFGYDFWERDYEGDGESGAITNPDEGDKRDYTAKPEIEVRSLGIHDTLSLRYAPVFKYDDLDAETETDHYLVAKGQRFLTKAWYMALADTFVLSDDPVRYGVPFAGPGLVDEGDEVAAEEEAADEITLDLGRRRYWTNDLVFKTGYTYAEDSDVGLGYKFRVLRNDSDDDPAGAGYDEYDRHEFSGFWNCSLNPFLGTVMDLRYIKGLYEDQADPAGGPSVSQDLEEYRAGFGLEYTKDVSNVFPLMYRYLGTRYEDLRPDNHVHELSAGWNHAFDKHSRLDIGAGPSYVDTEDLDGEWGYNAFLNYSRAFQHGSISALASKRYDPRNFTGSDDAGLVDTTDLRLNASYRFTPELSSTVYGSYRYEDILEPQGNYYLAALGDRDPMSEQDIGDVSYSRESFSVGARLEYTFLRWFIASIGYRYFEQDGDLARDSYSDHRVTFLISASRELWRQ